MDACYRILTATGRGAIAVVRVWGVDADAVVDAVFRPLRGRSLSDTLPGRLRLGRAGIGVGDEVVAVRIPSAVPTLEIHCHGGTAALETVIRALEAAGAAPADPVAFARTQAEDALRARALEDLAAAPTLRAAGILLDQSRGALNRVLEALLDSSHPDPRAELDALIQRADVGTRLLSGWKVVIAGRPNVGKSRLFNAVAGYERSIVHSRPGVTRDVVSVRTAIGGWPVELSDTAGDREAEDDVERLGIGRARRERREADLVLLVLDRSEPLQAVDRELLESTSLPLVAANKSDLPPAWDLSAIANEDRRIYPVSAETGAGLEDLLRVWEARLVPDPPNPAVPSPSGRTIGSPSCKPGDTSTPGTALGSFVASRRPRRRGGGLRRRT